MPAARARPVRRTRPVRRAGARLRRRWSGTASAGPRAATSCGQRAERRADDALRRERALRPRRRRASRPAGRGRRACAQIVGQPGQAHVDHDGLARAREGCPVEVAAAVLEVAGDEQAALGMVAVGQRDAGIGGHAAGGRDAGHHFEGHAGGGQRLQFLAAAAEARTGRRP